MRLDQFLVLKKLAQSRTQAQDFIANGFVTMDSKVISKASFDVTDELSEKIKVASNPLQKYVSRAGLKLEGAFKKLNLDVQHKVVLDVGQSTGGFSDCLIQSGAKKVVGVDVGHNQLHESLKAHSRIIAIENLNVKDIQQHRDFLRHVPEAGFDLLVMDVSFISILKVIPFVAGALKSGGEYLILVKPQFETEKTNLDLGEIEARVKACALQYFKNVSAYFESTLPGKDGTQEFFIYGKNV